MHINVENYVVFRILMGSTFNVIGGLANSEKGGWGLVVGRRQNGALWGLEVFGFCKKSRCKYQISLAWAVDSHEMTGISALEWHTKSTNGILLEVGLYLIQGFRRFPQSRLRNLLSSTVWWGFLSRKDFEFCQGHFLHRLKIWFSLLFKNAINMVYYADWFSKVKPM